MARGLEAPAGSRPAWDVIYLARGTEVDARRPVFTGDVFDAVPVLTPRGEQKVKRVVVIQHPCAMRPDGVDLAESILVAEVRQHRELAPEEWMGFGKLLPLPDLLLRYDSGKRHQAGFFDHTYHADPRDLVKRDACLSLRGVNLLLQRWVFHSSRVAVPTSDLDAVVSPVFEEADLIEEWCEIAMGSGRTLEEAINDVTSWLGQDAGGRTRRQVLEDPQQRPQMRRQLRGAAATWRAP